MKKVYPLFLILVTLTVFNSCKQDDDASVSYSQASAEGVYNLDALIVTRADMVVNTDGSVTEVITYTSTGSNFDVNWNLNPDRNFLVSGTYTVTISETINGEVSTMTEQRQLNREGTYIINETNMTLIFKPINDTDEVFEVINFSENGFDGRYERVDTEGVAQERFVIEISFVRS